MKTILVLTDFSKKSEHAAKMAMKIASASNAEVQLFSSFSAPQVFPSDVGVYPFFEDFSEEEKILNKKLKELAEKLADSFGSENRPKIKIKSQPGNLADNIKSLQPWLIVMGGKSKSSALSSILFGSNSSAVIDHANCPVLVVPETADLKPFKKIVFATDLHGPEKDALSFLEQFGSIWKAQIMVMHVSAPGSSEEKEDHYHYASYVAETLYPDLSYEDVRGIDVAKAISKYAGNQAINVIAITHKKRSLIGQLLHKSIGKDMLNYSHVPVLILNRAE